MVIKNKFDWKISSTLRITWQNLERTKWIQREVDRFLIHLNIHKSIIESNDWPSQDKSLRSNELCSRIVNYAAIKFREIKWSDAA